MVGRRLLALAGLVLIVACGGSAGSAPTGSTDGAIGATTPDHSTTPDPGSAGDPRSSVLTGRVIVVDPGHNGGNVDHLDRINDLVDAGGFQKACNTVGAESASGYPEAAFTWKLAHALRSALEAGGAKVVLTRSTNTGWGPCIDDRGKVAADAQADLLISVHADGNDDPGARGFHVIAPGLVPGYTDTTVDASAELARIVRDALVEAGFPASTYEGHAGLVTRTDIGTLNLAGVPAIMVECGNLRHRADAELLESAAGQERIARALADGVIAYLA